MADIPNTGLVCVHHNVLLDKVTTVEKCQGGKTTITQVRKYKCGCTYEVRK